MTEHLWTYRELKFVTVNQHDMDCKTLAQEVNKHFHAGRDIRSPEDIEKIKHGKTIFNKDKKK